MQMIRPVRVSEPESTTAKKESLPNWELEGLIAVTDRIVDSSYSPSGVLALLKEDDTIIFYDEPSNLAYQFTSDQYYSLKAIEWSYNGKYLACAHRAGGAGGIYFRVFSVDVSDLNNIFQTSNSFYWDNSSFTPPVLCPSSSDGDSVVFSSGVGVFRLNLGDGSYSSKSFEDIIADSGESTYSYERTEPAGASSENSTGSSTDWIFIACQNIYSDSFNEFAVLAYDFESNSSRFAEPASGYNSEEDTAGDISKEPGGSRLVAWIGSQLIIINESDLSAADQQPSLNEQPLEIKWLSGSSQYLIRKTNSPRLYLQNADDLSTAGLPSLEPDFDSSSATYSSSRIAVSSAGGYGFRLYRRSDLSQVQGTNPNVTEGDRFIFDQKVYEALTDNNDRPDNGAKADPPTWLDTGFINPLRMFDGSVGSRTTADDVLDVSIAPDGGQINAIALLNMQGASARVTMTDPDGNEYYNSGEISLLDNSAIDDWWMFFYEPYIELPDATITDLPPYVDGTINITVDALGTQAAAGEVVIGSTIEIGRTQYGASVGIEDYSRKETDEFGNFTVVERGYSNSGEFDVHLDPTRTPGIRNLLARFRATPAVYIGSTERSVTVIYGYYRDFNIVLSSFSIDECAIEVEGLQ